MIIKTIILHHSASDQNKTTIADIEAWHKLRWPGFISSLGWHIGYHFIITSSGKITQTRRENEIGAHAIPNEGRLGICLTGNFLTEYPTPEQLNSLGQLLERLKKDYGLTDEQIKGHLEVSQTLCPGDNFMLWLEKYRQVSRLKKMIEAIKRLIEALRR